MSIYKPTWLYIKQHNQTGLKYFGKTVQDPFKYKGSGVYWKSHLNKHGDDVSTIWVQLYIDETQMVEYAASFSKENNIVESKEWANLIDENGYGGAVIGHVVKDTTRQKIGEANKRRGPPSDETRAKLAKAASGRKMPPSHSIAVSKAKKGKKLGPQSEETRAKKSKTLTGFKRPPRTKEHIEKINRARQENKKKKLAILP